MSKGCPDLYTARRFFGNPESRNCPYQQPLTGAITLKIQLKISSLRKYLLKNPKGTVREWNGREQ